MRGLLHLWVFMAFGAFFFAACGKEKKDKIDKAAAAPADIASDDANEVPEKAAKAEKEDKKDKEEKEEKDVKNVKKDNKDKTTFSITMSEIDMADKSTACLYPENAPMDETDKCKNALQKEKIKDGSTTFKDLEAGLYDVRVFDAEQEGYEDYFGIEAAVDVEQDKKDEDKKDEDKKDEDKKDEDKKDEDKKDEDKKDEDKKDEDKKKEKK